MIYQQTEGACDCLLEKAKKYRIGAKWEHFPSATPSGSSYKYRRVVANLDWHRPEELIFQSAHELAHVIHGDTGGVVFYHTSFAGKESTEYGANAGAVELLVPFYCQGTGIQCVNSINFMQSFHVPHYLVSIISEKTREYYKNQPTSNHDRH